MKGKDKKENEKEKEKEKTKEDADDQEVLAKLAADIVKNKKLRQERTRAASNRTKPYHMW